MNVVAVLSIIHGISARIIEVFIFLALPMMLVVASLRISPAVLTGEEKSLSADCSDIFVEYHVLVQHSSIFIALP